MWELPVWVIYIIFFMSFFIATFFFFVYIEKKLEKKKPEKPFYADVTFVLPCYNVAGVLESSVESIKNSNYPQERIKIILVNDGSTDNTLEVANKLAKRYKNIEVISKKNEGRKAAALNFGLKRAKTELVAVLDADTILERNLLKECVFKFADENIAVSTCRMRSINNNKLIEKLQNVEYAFAGFYRILMGKINAFSIAPAFSVLRREFLVKYGYFDAKNITEDLEMGLRAQSKHYDVGCVENTYAETYVPDTIKNLSRQRMRWAWGTFYNYFKYKKLFLNKKYGDFGVFMLPIEFLNILLLSFVFLLFLYTTFNWLWIRADLLMAGWLPSFNLDISRTLFSFTEPRVLLFLIMLVIGLAFFFLIKSEFKENIKLREYALFVTVYMWYLAIIYIVAFVYVALGKNLKW